MSGETLAKRLQRVLVDAPDERSGEHLIYEGGAVAQRLREEFGSLRGAQVHPQHAAVRHIVEAPLYEATLHDAVLHLPVVHAHAEVAFEDVDAAIVPSVSTALTKKKRMGPLRRLVVRRDARLSVPNEPPLKIILADQTHSPRGVVLVKEGQQRLIHGLDPVGVVVRSRRRRTAPGWPPRHTTPDKFSIARHARNTSP